MTLRNLRQEHDKKNFLASDDSDIHAVYRVEEHDVVLDQAEKFYLQTGNLQYLNARLTEIVLRVIFVLRR